ncbi:YcaO-like family protein [Kitasatospora mediocidica]|uniref:YcaO-like family protein n=1 Tax=Kitasatospora mediocidica TaxID=58352 RepID=UPI00056BB0D5|nr:YcaO-like family protein [Kitasatospora mediocidica]
MPLPVPHSAPTEPDRALGKPAERWSAQVFQPFPAEPRLLFGRVAARSAFFGRTGSTGGERVLIGSSAGTDPGEVAVRARGELLERMGSVLAGREAEQAPTVQASHAELRRRGDAVLDPAPWSGADSRAARQLWVPGRSLLSGDEILVPAGLAFLQHRPPAGCAVPSRSGSTGLSAHPRRAAALAHAAHEVLERDLLRRSWCAPALYPPTAHAVRCELPPAVVRLCEELGLLATALTLPTPAPGACAVAVCLHTADRREQSFGARFGPTGQRADLLARAAYEALMVRWSMTTPAALRAGQRLSVTGVPSDAVDHALWAFHGGQDALAHWLGDTPVGGPTTPLPDPGDGSASTPDDPDDPVRLLAAYTGQDVVAVEYAPAALRDEGLAFVRLLAPGARPLPSASRTDPGVPPHPFG